MLDNLNDRIDCISIVQNLGRLQAYIVNTEDVRSLGVIHCRFILGNLREPSCCCHLYIQPLWELVLIHLLMPELGIKILADRNKGIHACGLSVTTVSTEYDSTLGGITRHCACYLHQIAKDFIVGLTLNVSDLNILLISHNQKSVGARL